MERMEKQTAVEWLIESLEKLEYDLEKGNISLDDYIINAKWFKNRAKEKEKIQMEDNWKDGMKSDNGHFGTMKPQEKAQELINSFSPHAKNWDCFYDIPLDENHTKKCALIAVDEILSLFVSDCEDTRYWQEVKQEIEKL